MLLNRLIKGRHRTQSNGWPAKDCSSSNQGSLAAEVNNTNTLRVESSPQTCVRGNSLTTMKKPNLFNEKIHVETWLVQLEIYSRPSLIQNAPDVENGVRINFSRITIIRKIDFSLIITNKIKKFNIKINFYFINFKMINFI